MSKFSRSESKVRTIYAGVYHYANGLQYLIYDLYGHGSKQRSMMRSEFQKRIDRLNNSKRVIKVNSYVADDNHSALAMVNEYIVRVP